MVKRTADFDKVTKFLTKSLLDEDLDPEIVFEDLLNLLYNNQFIEYASFINKAKNRLYSSRNLEDRESSFSEDELISLELDHWGYFCYKPGPKSEAFNWEDFASNLTLFIHSLELKIKSQLISNLTSEIRKTLRPDLALEKIYKKLEDFAQIVDFSFYKRLINNDNDGEVLFKGYSLYFHNGELKDNSESDKSGDNYLGKILQQSEIRELKNNKSGKYTEIFNSKVRGREWGIMVVTRNTAWTQELYSVFELFSEQMATVFNQHELHAESLTLAQREFLLNQVSTKIRESLAVDHIIETAVQEIAHVMGVESCGLLILDRRIRGSLGHRTWSINEDYDSKTVEALYNSLRTDLEPNWLQPSVQLSNIEVSSNPDYKRLQSLGVKSYLTCGLFNDATKELIGVLALAFYSQDRSWTNDERLLVEGACKQLEIALTQASIYQEAQQTKRQMALLHKLSNDIRDSLDIAIVLGQIAKGIGEVLGLNRCFVRRFTEDNMILKTEEEYCSHNYPKTSDLIFGFEREWIKSLSQKNKLDSSNDILNIPSIEAKFEQDNPGLVKIAKIIGLKSYLAVPLVARGKILGTINVHQCDRERTFLSEEIEFIMRVGSEAAIALEHAALFETINRFNKTDPDTGLYNKRYFREVALSEIAKAKRTGKEISFMLVDVDNLKDINDNHEHGGHEAGDEAIQILAKVLANTVRQTPVDEINKRISDVVGRFGGDEFMVLLPNTSVEEAITAAKRVEANLAKTRHSTWPKPLTCSIGVAGTPHDPYDYETLKTLADKALYLSKRKGRNTISSTLELEVS
jgi:diguanylate cyclase (GGDEF)-like protein